MVLRAAAAAALAMLALGAEACEGSTAVPLRDSFTGRDGLITNELATYNPTRPGLARSAVWVVTSGSLLRRRNQAWTGVPDAGPADARSRRATGSAVFRLLTRRAYGGNVAVSFSLTNLALTSSPRTPPHGWDGVHAILRWHSVNETYYVTVNRRDGTVIVKKKLPGPTGGGTYVDLAPPTRFPLALRAVQHVRITVVDQPDGTVAIALYVNGARVLTAADGGVDGPPIRGPGRVGLRGDNDEFLFDDFAVRRLG